MSYENDTYIEETKLHVECLDQPRLMKKYSDLLAEAKRALEHEKHRLDVLKAELDKAVRANPEVYEIHGKITEAQVTAAITTSADHKKLSEAIIELQYEVNMLKGTVDAINSKKDMLEELIRLHGQNYFSGPNVPHNIEDDWIRRLRQSTANQKVKIKRKNK